MVIDLRLALLLLAVAIVVAVFVSPLAGGVLALVAVFLIAASVLRDGTPR